MSNSKAQLSEAARDPVPSITGIPAATRPPPGTLGAGPIGWARQNLFGSIPSGIMTIVLAVVLVRAAIGFIDWATVQAVWSVPEQGGRVDTSPCRNLQGAGACWAVVTSNYCHILFGQYPYRSVRRGLPRRGGARRAAGAAEGQYDAADALGLSHWKKTRLIIVPQALRAVIPPLVNTFIGLFKDTSLILIIGDSDLLLSGHWVLGAPEWRVYNAEIYLVLAAIYFVFCFVAPTAAGSSWN